MERSFRREKVVINSNMVSVFGKRIVEFTKTLENYSSSIGPESTGGGLAASGWSSMYDSISLTSATGFASPSEQPAAKASSANNMAKCRDRKWVDMNIQVVEGSKCFCASDRETAADYGALLQRVMHEPRFA